MDMFSMNMDKQVKKNAPLADRMRPKTLEQFVGQKDVVGENNFLNRSIKADRISSMIFYGPPGTGKTTLANIIANTTNMNFEKLSAVTSGVKDIRSVVARAEELLKLYNKRTIVFIDEIHRFNKSQQDALLPYVEKGIIILIGATTENPYFEVNKALLSRVMIIPLKALDDNDIKTLINKSLKDKERGLGNLDIEISDEAIDYLINISEGDGRFALNSLEISVLSTNPGRDGKIQIDKDIISDSTFKRNLSYDKNGEEHYNIISAFIKSMRGSDPDAALYWLARMIESGEDPKFIARRILITASEDIGNADPNALSIGVSTFQAVEYLGLPEGRHALAQAVVYMATAPKSNSSYAGLNEALDDVRNNKSQEVPNHLKEASYKGASKLGHGKGYKYPFDYDGNYVRQDYMSVKKKYYYPSNSGYEAKIKKRMDDLLDKK